MNWKQRSRNLAIENLSAYVVALSVIFNGYLMLAEAGTESWYLGVSGMERVFEEGAFYDLILNPFRINVSTGFWGIINLFFYGYIFYIFGGQLEAQEGSGRYTGYIGTGVLATAAGSLIDPGGSGWYLLFSVMLAVAYLNPRQEILLFFFIPVQLRWLAIVGVALVILNAFGKWFAVGDPLALLGPFFGLFNFLVFYVWRMMRPQLKQRARRAHLQAVAREPMHECRICGLTEIDDPRMDFRYCVDCDDEDAEYCINHLTTHEHV